MVIFITTLMKRKIAIELNSVDFLKHTLFKDFKFPAAAANLNLTQERILMTVKNSNQLPMVTIARAIGLEKGPFSQTVDKLVELDLIRRVKSAADKRLVFLELSQKGYDMAQTIEDSMDEHFNEKMSLLSATEFKAFFNALDILRKTAEILTTNK